MKYEELTMEVVRFDSEDIIRTSGTRLPIDEDEG